MHVWLAVWFPPGWAGKPDFSKCVMEVDYLTVTSPIPGPGSPTAAPTATPTAAPVPPGSPTATPTATPTAAPVPPGVPTAAPTKKPGGLPNWLLIAVVAALVVSVVGCVLGWWHYRHSQSPGWLFAEDLRLALSPRSKNPYEEFDDEEEARDSYVRLEDGSQDRPSSFSVVTPRNSGRIFGSESVGDVNSVKKEGLVESFAGSAGSTINKDGSIRTYL